MSIPPSDPLSAKPIYHNPFPNPSSGQYDMSASNDTPGGGQAALSAQITGVMGLPQPMHLDPRPGQTFTNTPNPNVLAM